MTATVSFILADGTVVVVEEGGIIGRSVTAALRLDAPDVSEAHALVSRRDASLHLLALRGITLVHGVATRDAELRPGVAVTLGATTRLEVASVDLGTRSAPDVPPTLGGESTRLEIRLRDGTLTLRQGAGPPLTLSGNQAALLELLLDAQRPVNWMVIAHYFWPERDQPSWRQRFDATVKELRAKLREHAIRPDLFSSTQGEWELNLHEGDQVTGAPRRLMSG